MDPLPGKSKALRREMSRCALLTFERFGRGRSPLQCFVKPGLHAGVLEEPQQLAHLRRLGSIAHGLRARLIQGIRREQEESEKSWDKSCEHANLPQCTLLDQVLHHQDLRSRGHAVVKIDEVFGQQADAAG